MARYVILRHDTPPGFPRATHWDLLFEIGQCLRAWALAEEPQADCEIAAESLPDHRLAYLDYEGPVSGDRGAVSQWDAGTVQWQQDSNEIMEATLDGRRLHGLVRLTHAAGTLHTWTFLFHAVRASS
jgi:hypothetical protein